MNIEEYIFKKQKELSALRDNLKTVTICPEMASEFERSVMERAMASPTRYVPATGMRAWEFNGTRIQIMQIFQKRGCVAWESEKSFGVDALGPHSPFPMAPKKYEKRFEPEKWVDRTWDVWGRTKWEMLEIDSASLAEPFPPSEKRKKKDSSFLDELSKI